MDQRVRRGVLKAEGVPGQSTSVVQATVGYSTSSILRGYKKGDQFGSAARVGLDAKPIYFVSKVLQGPEVRYQAIEKATLAVVFSARRLRHYFQSFTKIVMTDLPIHKVLQKPDVASRMVQWEVELSEFDVQYEHRGSIKGQVYADFVVELSLAATHQEGAGFKWVLSVDGSSNQQGSGSGVILEGQNGLLIEQALQFPFKASNN